MIEVTTFVVAGPQAHFRKFYGTNTALSYYLPPRTTLMGLLAARCGWPKGSYHERLNCSRILIGVGPEVPLKKSFHRVNNLKVETGAHFRGSEGRQQTPLELVTGLRFGRDEVAYRVWIAPTNNESQADYQEIVAALRKPTGDAFACCLGAAFCIARIQEVQTLQAEQISVGERLRLGTVVAGEAITGFWRKPIDGDADYGERAYTRGLGDGVQLEEEIMVLDFEPHSRAAAHVLRAICPTGHERPIVTLDEAQTAYRTKLDDQDHEFTFLSPFGKT